MSYASKRIRATLLLLTFVLFSSPSAFAVQRTFVSTVGSDSNTASNCSNTAPCRGFAAALTVTDSGGEIIVKDSGGYGPVTVNKTVSLIAPDGVYAGISVASGDGISIATAGVAVVLKGLTVNGTGGTNGINMTAGNSLTVEKCTITNFGSGYGIHVNAAATVRIVDSLLLKNLEGTFLEGGAIATVSGSRFLGNTYGFYVYATGSTVTTTAEVNRSEANGNEGAGFFAFGNSSGTVKLNIKDSEASRNTWGVYASSSSGTASVSVSGSLVTGNSDTGLASSGAGAKLVASGNVVTHNLEGLYQSSSAVLVSTGDNTVSDNTTATVGTITSLSKM